MYIAIDIGGTNIRIASFDPKTHKLLSKTSFEVHKDFENAIQVIVNEIRQISKNNRIQGIGIAAPGLIDKENGVIKDSSNLPTWNNKPIKDVLEKEFKTDVRIDNDMAVAAIGEYLFGFGKDEESFIYIIWGTGFGGAYVRKIGEQIQVLQLELGHQILVWDGLLCGCKQKGCAEAYLGGGYAEKAYGSKFSNETSNEIWNKVTEKAGHALINTINHLPVNLMVFGGGVVNKQNHLTDRVKKIVSENMTTYPTPDMKLSKLGEDGGLYGGVGLFLVDTI